MFSTASFELVGGLYERVTVQRLDHLCGPFLARSLTEQGSEGMFHIHTLVFEDQHFFKNCKVSLFFPSPCLLSPRPECGLSSGKKWMEGYVCCVKLRSADI